MAKTVAEQFVETFAAAGVKRIYGIVGDSLNGLTDAIRRQGKIEWIHVRHERSRRSQPAPKPISRVSSPFAPAAADRATCTSSTAYLTVTARAFPCSASLRKFHP
jgi:Thiamine pyrophosphate enzyme, N-terminal TPP binding domain